MRAGQLLTNLLKERKSAISRLFLLLMSLTVISIIVIISVWTFNVHNTVHELSEYYISDIVRNANSKFEKDLYVLRSNVKTITESTAVRNYASDPTDQNRQTVREYLVSNLNLLINDIRGIAFISPDSDITAGAYFPENLAHSEWYARVTKAGGNPIIFNRKNISGLQNVKGISIAAAVIKDSTPVGVIVMDLSESVITSHFGMNHMNGLLRTMILDPDNDIIFVNQSDINKDKIIGILDNINSERKFDSLNSVKFDGEEYFVMAKRFSASPDWLNITFCPTKSLYSSYNQMLRLLMTIMVLVIFITIILSMLTFSSTKKSFKQLSQHIETIDLNNINEVQAFAPSSDDSEIIMISDKINQLVETISDQLGAINALEEKKRIDEIQILKAQINPHMIYNTLNVIQTSAEYQKNTTISEIAKSLAVLLQYSVTDTDKLVKLQNEFEYIRNYITLMQHKFINDIHLEVMAEDSILNCMTLKMLLQPIVENSIKHGFSDKPGQYIIIKAYRSDNKILIKITDNGLGIAPAKLDDIFRQEDMGSKHLGLNNVSRRLKLTFGSEYGIKVSSIPSVQTTVIIEIPYIRGNEVSE